MFCAKCAATLADNATFCSSCGTAVNPQNNTLRPAPAAGTDWLTTLLLCLFLGKIGVHRFYSGHTLIGILMFFTLGCCGILWLFDLVMIITENFKDSEGRALVKRN